MRGTASTCVLATPVSHYVHNRVAALRELHRVLVPEGWLILSTSHQPPATSHQPPATSHLTADGLTDGGSYFDAHHVEQSWIGGMKRRFSRQPDGGHGKPHRRPLTAPLVHAVAAAVLLGEVVPAATDPVTFGERSVE
ncbi:class I SAM-dependent methyltransferase [Streptomyces sp. NPDC057877]|uniref:class I SAM-dependent methyltransferase n=1 Tax=Streptomyces sp. NPDC057877 TaxID=3346269 RepID=UPI0036A2C8F6